MNLLTRRFLSTVRQSTPPLRQRHAFYDDTAERYARKPLTPITLQELIKMAEKPVTPEKLIINAQYVARELPVRLARRVRSMQQLPYIVGLNPHIRQVYVLYQESFEKIRSHDSIQDLESEKEFTELLSELVDNHTNVIAVLAEGIEECKVHMTESQVTSFLDLMIQARIGIRVIAEHHLALHEEVDGYSGIINHRLSPFAMIRKCAPLAQSLSEANYGSFPDFTVDGHLDTTFPYIDVHLEYILFELMKNSFRATVEYSKLIGRKEHPPVQITIGKGDEDVSIRIRDCGGGIPASKLKSVWKYSFSTVSEDEDFLSAAMQLSVVHGTGGPMAGLGFGLPMTKIYSGWAGGSINLVSLDGYGTDVFLRLPFIGNAGPLHV
eukprot:Partr_v1_DN28865_c0_g1_i3_m34474 putative Branched chain ketoacid dehydrogenase kinase